MIIAPTQKLYFKKFTYCLKFKFIEQKGFSVRGNHIVKQIKNLLAARKIKKRTRLDWGFLEKNIDITFSVYFSDDETYTILKDNFKEYCTWASIPITSEHKELLLNNVEIVFRDKLLYNRFRYKIIFSLGWKREKLAEIDDWIKNQFENRINSRKGDYFTTGSWLLSLYLKDETDLTMVRLSLNEHIRSVLKVEIITNCQIPTS